MINKKGGRYGKKRKEGAQERAQVRVLLKGSTQHTGTKTKDGGKKAAVASTVSSSISLLGSYNICHSLCLGALYVLGLLGITAAGLPFLFLQDYAIYFWSLAVLLLAISLAVMHTGRKCLPAKLLIANIGIIIASVPFQELQPYLLFFYLAGSVVILYAVVLHLKLGEVNLWKRKE
ncbi:MAG: hypothetical protein HY519_02765 [Candidatus Aenigmarchaeota archaeon]|nr:hypothetical protein [Candidatus Aenigmarchaeota archaeon]